MGIKSFQGARKQRVELDTTSLLKVRDYMTTNLITFTKDQNIEIAIQAFIKYRISGAPVVNEKNELIGIISEGDCIKQINESRYYNMPILNKAIENYMIKEVETIDANMHIFDAANKFLTKRFRRFPITENGKLIGQISQKDILKATLDLQGQNWK